nr:reverse transcriptase domain-containing protein [Tanacetum cinerariifolium]
SCLLHHLQLPTHLSTLIPSHEDSMGDLMRSRLNQDKDDDEEDEHLALADSFVVPVIDHVPSASDTNVFETDESAPTPRSPQIIILSPSLLVSSPPLPLPSPLTTSLTDAGAPLGYRAAKIRMRDASPPLLFPSTSQKTDIIEAEMPSQKIACFSTLALGFEAGENTYDEIVETMLEIAPTTLEGVNQRVTELATTVRQDTDKFYKMAPKGRTATTPTTSTSMTYAQIKALIERGITATLAERDADRSINGDDNHDSRTGGRRQESDKVEKYVGGLPDMIYRSVKASKPKTMQEAIKFLIELMDPKILTLAERQAEKKGKFDDTSRNNQNQQQPFKRNNVAHAYTVGPKEKKPYRGSKPLFPKCNYNHDGQCAPKCTNCKRIAHSAWDCKSQPAAANKNQRAQGINQRVLT